MRVLRVLLAFLLGAGPVQAQPVVDLLSRYVIPADEAASSAPEGDSPQGSGKRLAVLESDLALVSESLEGFAHPQDADKALLAAKPRLPAGTAPFFKDRAMALGALYRTLAVVDYTWALRFPDPPCAPAAKRSALLRSDDGLFLDPFSGKTSPWMTALLGPNAKGKDLESALDQASAAVAPSEAEYARLRARQNLITKALASEDAFGEARANLYCKRAETRVKLAAANRAAGPMLAARSSREESSRRGLILLAGKTAEGLEVRGAGVVLETKSGIRVLTDRRLGAGEVVALLDGRSVPVPLSVDREDERSGLLLLRPDGDLGEALTLADAAPKKDDLVFAFAHSDRLGAWTKTQGLVTSSDPDQFQTDAVADASMTGGAVLDEEGRVAGLLVLRRGAGSTIDWPAAVPAPALREWLDGGTAPAASPVDLSDQGTTKILTASRPLLQSVAVGEGATTAGYGFDTQTQWGNVHARCMANCTDSSPSSSYSDNANAELGEALGKLAVIGVEALIFKGIPALFRGIGSLFKSKPRAAAPPPHIVEAKPAATVPEPPKEPPKIECTLTPIGVPESMGVETVKVKVQLKCPGLPEAELRGSTITFTLGWNEKNAQPKEIATVSDELGYASFSFYIDNEIARAERSFNDLDRYDPDNKRPPEAESITATDETPLQNASRVEGPINAADHRPALVESKPTKAPPADSGTETLALIGAGALIRTEASFAGFVVGRAAPALAAGTLGGAVTLVVIGATVIITVRWELASMVAEHDNRTNAIDPHKPTRTISPKPVELIKTPPSRSPAVSSAESHADKALQDLSATESDESARDDVPPECDDWQEKVRRLRKGMRSLQRRINEHLDKIQLSPNSRDVNHWQVEIRTFRDNIQKNEAEARRLEELCGEK